MSRFLHTGPPQGPGAADDHRMASGPPGATDATAVLTVLLVDDNAPVLVQLQKVLDSLELPCRVEVASNGQEAISLLQTTKVDVLMTDLSMPFGDGFSLLTYVKRTQSNLPVMVVTGMAPTDYAGRLDPFGSITVIAKPIDQAILVKELLNLLEETSTGELHGVTLPGFLQLIAMERKSCSIRVRSGELLGRLHFKSGELVNAYTFDDDLEGEAAAHRILSWSDVDIEVERSYHNHKQLIESPLNSLLLAAAVAKDEARGAGTHDRTTPEPEAATGSQRATVTAETTAPGSEDGSLAVQDPDGRQPDPNPDRSARVRARFSHVKAMSEERPTRLPSTPVPVWGPTGKDSTELERDLNMALERLTSRARQLDEAVNSLLGEVGAMLATRKRLEQQERERRRGLERLRDVLTAAVENLEKILS